MFLSNEKMIDICPICGAELAGNLSCPSCQFKIELPYGDVEAVDLAMKIETEREPNDYSCALENQEPVFEDPMKEYMAIA